MLQIPDHSDFSPSLLDFFTPNFKYLFQYQSDY